MLIRVNAILWRRWNEATFDSLQGHSKGQYDIRLSTAEFAPFFADVARTEHTDLGGYSIDVPLHAFTGANPVPGQQVTVRFMGAQSKRRDWNIPSQRPETAYDLWRRGRGVPSSFTAAGNEYLIIVRDVNGGFHARWINDAHFAQLPPSIQAMMRADDVNWSKIA